ncbi:MAG: X-Pro aminopeptidase [Bacteroidetes bacterium GWE2_29_8]|nr:MAG: X-Pro aminopeptidase [Bacteroidetes bacterium GWE2_29_8]OFY22321.1 MAG: X-Pro aminopeptidase [Bacteroidetes bacterium GWF2_29_10]
MRYKKFDQAFFINNRKRFCNNISSNSLVIFHSNDEMPRNGDQSFPFRQNSDLFYLCGIDQEDSILVLFPDCKIEAYREILFLTETNEHIRNWYGYKYSKEQATDVSGVKTVMWLSSFDNVLKELMGNALNVYLNSNENIRYSNKVVYKDLRFAKSLKEEYPLHTYLRSAPIMQELRVVKSAEEVKYIQIACDITGEALKRVLKFIKPGVLEYEIEAELNHEFIRNGCSGYSFYPIVASGADSCILHYVNNDKMCKDGDLVLLDFGAEYGNYASDMSRTVPINGKFSKRQRDVYMAVLRVMREAEKLLKVGNTIDAYHSEVCNIMNEELIKLGLYTSADVKSQDPTNPLFKKYFMHGTSHFMGMDVHDLGCKQDKILAGMVFSCEPGIYIKEEGIGIRLENTVLITESGSKDLYNNLLLEPDEIEEFMKK